MTGSDPEAGDTQRSTDLSSLSEREQEIFAAAVEGVTAREIAGRFSLSEATVRSHLSSIYSKVGVTGRLELLARLSRKPAAGSPLSPGNSARVAGEGRDSSPRLRPRVAIVAIVAVMVGVAAAVFLVVRPDLPPRSDLATVFRSLATGQVTDLSLVGETLTVTAVDGQRLRVDGVTESQAEPLWAAAVEQMQREPGQRIAISKGGISETSQLAIVASTLVLPLSVVVIAGLLLRAVWRRRPPLRPAV